MLKKEKKKKKEKKIVYTFHCIILLRARVCMRHLVTLSLYDDESSYLSQLVLHLRETCDIHILGYLDPCLSITPSISYVTSLEAMM